MSILVFGEALWDAYLAKPSAKPKNASGFGCEFYPGGAPANVAVTLARLGLPVTLLSAVGQDIFGARLVAWLQSAGVDTQRVAVLAGVRTAILFVDKEAGRMLPYRTQTADGRLSRELFGTVLAVNKRGPARDNYTLAVVGSSTLSTPAARKVTGDLQARFCNKGFFVDLNVRPGVWPQFGSSARARIVKLARSADLVKASEDDLQHLQISPADLAGRAPLLLTRADKSTLIFLRGAVHEVQTRRGFNRRRGCLLRWHARFAHCAVG
jgi:fructokinase